MKIIKGIAITIIMSGLFLVFAYQQTHYIRVGHVVLYKTRSIENEYTFSDSTGQEYNFITTERITPYDTVKVTMFNNCTEENIYDDMIINYKIVSRYDSENEK